MQPRFKWTLVALAAIWLGVLVTSFLAPDLVSGSQQEHLKVAALVNWLWGALATVSVLRALRYRGTARDGAWTTIGLGTAAIWIAVVVFTLLGPSVDTGSDPTTIPLSAIIAPVAGMLLTRFLVEFAVDVGAAPDSRSSAPTTDHGPHHEELSSPDEGSR